MIYSLKNKWLTININQIGAELCAIKSTRSKRDFMWSGNPDIWRGFAPNLFPIIGALKDNTFIYEGHHYLMSKHGFVRHSKDFEIHDQSYTSITFLIKDSESLFKIYPFKFQLYITYTLKESSIVIKYRVKNPSSDSLFFSIGGHPAFKCPIYEDESYSDYYLGFEQPEIANTFELDKYSGLLNGNRKSIFENPNKINLAYDLFNDDALIFKDLISKKVSLNSRNHGLILTVSFKDFKYLGIWAKPNADYVCIEPWLGIADSANTDQVFNTKEGIIKIEGLKEYEAEFAIEIEPSHLG